MRTLRQWRWMGLCIVFLSMLVLSSCAWFGQQSSPPPSPIGQPSQSPSTPAAQSSLSAPRPTFYDFQDVPVPTELKLRSSDSYVFQSGSLKAGLLTLRGRVDTSSIINFFQVAMPRENWKPKGGFRSQRSVLIFEKPDKTCVINVYEKMFFSYVEIYVAPATGQI